ncbi:MAG TPA: glycoside hydrolase family 130 protein [Pyrinomonadaceae bacterium]|nr:glycoside hydrolase family 130 protein [Pyrinomonadaceae bacterium]
MSRIASHSRPAHALRITLFISLLSLVAVATISFTPPFGAWKRLSAEPIISPRGEGFEAAGVFNPAVLKKDGEFVMLYRAQDRNGTSRLGYATSKDGINFIRRADPVMWPETDYEKDGGIEDPRLLKIGDTYYLTYTGYNKKDAQLCLAVSKDLINWERKGVILPAYKGRWNVGWTKAGAIVPQKIKGRYWMYFMADADKGPNQMGVAYSSDLVHWTEPLDQPVLKRRPGYFDSYVVEPGPPPVITEDGIFMVYNGADDKVVYATGWVLFDKDDPTKVLARSDQPIFRAEKEWEKIGQVPNVVFVEGMVRDGKRWLFYYGGADKYVGVAVATAR